MQRILLTIAIALASACSVTAEANEPAPIPLPAGTRLALADALARGLVTFEARGAGASHITLAVRARADFELVVPAGTFFEARGDVQNMVVTKGLAARVTAGTTVALTLDTACASYHRPVPQATHAFALRAAEPRLHALVTCLEHRDISDGRRQTLVWQVTDLVEPSEVARRPDRVRPFLVEACTTRLHQSAARCEKLVDRAFAVALDRWLGTHTTDGADCL